ncbi:MAG: endonuclease [Glaciihabitans sp.]|nr:endonuclease [Glaciihabitans sp.]
MTENLIILRQATALLARVAGVDFAALPDDEVCGLLVAIEAAGRLVDTARVRVAGEVEDRSRFELGVAGLSLRLGHRKPVHLIEERTRVSQAEAFRRMRLGRSIRPRLSFTGEWMPAERPHVAAALLDGSLGLDCANSIVAILKQTAAGCDATPDRMDAAERSLVDTGLVDSADLVALEGRVWREALDPDGSEPRFEDILKRRGLRMGRERNGLTEIHISSDPVSTALIRAALADSTVPGAVPRFLSEDDRQRAALLTDASGGEPDALMDPRSPMDPRTTEQKRFDILLGVIQAGVRETRDSEAHLRTTGSVTAVISLAELASGVGVDLLDGELEPIPASVVQQMVCDAGLRIAVLGGKGEPLYQGRRERLFTPAQRRALAVRDGGCVGPGCTAPPSWCHAHHVKSWQAHGPTDVDNGVLLCSAHHHALHSEAFDIEIRDGRPWLRLHSYLEGAGDWRAVGRSRMRRAVAA